MKTKLFTFLALTLLSTLNPQLSTCFAQGTAFTYQGRLNDGASPANGIYDLRFTIYDAVTNGSAVSGVLTNAATSVSNGLFTVTLDFGAGAFPGADRWLEIAVRTNGSAGDYQSLSPRQPVTATPYAIRALNVGTNGLAGGTYLNALTLSNAANVFVGNGAGLTGLNASQLTGGTVPAAALSNAWQTTGNTGTTPGAQFLGTTDNQPLEIKVNGLRALRLEHPGANGPNVIGGYGGNTVLGVNAVGATISGGGQSGTPNSAATFSTVGGGQGNTASNSNSMVGGGLQNTAGGYASTVPGGSANVASGDYSFAAGLRAKATHQGAFVWADSTLADFASTANDQFMIRASGGVGINCAPVTTLQVQSARVTGGDNTAVFYNPNLGPNYSHIHYGLTGDWYIRSATNGGKVVLQDNPGNVGIGTGSPGAKLDVRGDVKLGASGELFSPGGVENLRILRGTINGDGSIASGSGFTVSRLGTGSYQINYTTAFSDYTSVSATPWGPLGAPRIATLSVSYGTLCQLVISTPAGALVDAAFDFIAIGPR